MHAASASQMGQFEAGARTLPEIGVMLADLNGVASAIGFRISETISRSPSHATLRSRGSRLAKIFTITTVG